MAWHSFSWIPPLMVEPDILRNHLANLASYIKSSRPSKQGGEVLLPGEPEQRMREKWLA